MTKYKIGDVVKCKVTGIEKYGIFVSLPKQYSGLIHISEISDGFVREVGDFVQVGEEIDGKIIDVLEDEKQLKLSIKNVKYRADKMKGYIEEGAQGFEPLREQLPTWVESKIKEME